MPLFKDKAKKLMAEIRTVRNFKACTFVEAKTEDERNFLSHVQQVMGIDSESQSGNPFQASNNSVVEQINPIPPSLPDPNNNNKLNRSNGSKDSPGLTALYSQFHELSLTNCHSASSQTVSSTATSATSLKFKGQDNSDPQNGDEDQSQPSFHGSRSRQWRQRQSNSQPRSEILPAQLRLRLGLEVQETLEGPGLQNDLPYNMNPEDALSNFNRKWSLTTDLGTNRRSSVEPEEEKQKQRNLDDFHLLKVVGKGAFGKVLLVQCRLSGQFYAMKVLDKKTILETNNMKGVLNEKRILQCVQFPFLVQLRHHFKDAKNLYMVMEFVGGGDLFFHLRRKLQFTEKESQFYGGQIVLAIEYLHSLGIVFRDLKPENILINSDGYIKLTDFGLAKRLSGLGRTKTMLGTAEYLAPEIFLQKPYGKSVDWWAVGILLYEMVHGRSPFRSNSDKETFEKILSGKVKFGQTSPHFKSLVTHLLQEEPSKRFGTESADDIKNHAWFESLNWKMLLQKRIESPYIPKLRHRGDTRFFDKYPDDFSELRHVQSQAQGVYKDCFVDF